MCTVECWNLLAGNIQGFDLFRMLFDVCFLFGVPLISVGVFFQMRNKFKKSQTTSLRTFLLFICFLGTAIGMGFSEYRKVMKVEAKLERYTGPSASPRLTDFYVSDAVNSLCRRTLGYQWSQFDFLRPRHAFIDDVTDEELEVFVELCEEMQSLRTLGIGSNFRFSVSHLDILSRIPKIDTIVIDEQSELACDSIQRRFPNSEIVGVVEYGKWLYENRNEERSNW